MNSSADEAQRLLEARQWHARHWPQHDLMGIMRTTGWRPAALTPYLVRFDPMSIDVKTHRAREVERVCVAREYAIRREGHRTGEPVTAIDGGRLLGFRPDDTLSDGAAEAASNGWFDVDNEPPWDAWIAYDAAAGVLAAWVPPEFVDAVQDAVDANPEGCIYWLGDEEARRLASE